MVLSLVTWDSFWPSAALARVGPGDDSGYSCGVAGLRRPLPVHCGPRPERTKIRIPRCSRGIHGGSCRGPEQYFQHTLRRPFRTRPGRNAARAARVDVLVKKIGFLSFGHWSSSPGSHTRSASDALRQSIDLAVAAEELGADGAYFRVHHFARQLGSPFPLLAAIGARTSRIEIGTAVIDMRYENPLYMAEDAGAADLKSGGRLQLGIIRGSPEQRIDAWRYFGYQPHKGQTDADMARGHAQVLLEVLRGEGFAQPNPRPMFPEPARPAAPRAVLIGAAGAHLVGCRVTADRPV